MKYIFSISQGIWLSYFGSYSVGMAAFFMKGIGNCDGLDVEQGDLILFK